MRKFFNLLNVSVRVIAAFAQYDTKERPFTSILMGHADFLKVAYNMAVVFRVILTAKGVKTLNGESCNTLSEKELCNRLVSSKIMDDTMLIFLPYGSLRGDIIHRVVEAVPLRIFNEEHVEIQMEDALLPKVPIAGMEDSMDIE